MLAEASWLVELVKQAASYTVKYGGEASPWLMLGFLLAGLLKALAPPGFLYRFLGGRGLRSIALATIVGIPLPLCSCGVIPVGVGLYRQGASRAATLAFFISTPATTVTAVVLAMGMLGWRFAVAWVLTCFAVAFLTGLLSLLLQGVGVEGEASAQGSCVVETPRPLTSLKDKARGVLEFGFVEMVDDLGLYILAGLLITGLVAALAPGELIEQYLGGGLLPLLVMALVGTPVYVCSTSSIPFVASLIDKGMSAAAGLVFLIAGPATNASTIMAVGKSMGWRTAALYVSSMMSLSIAFAYALQAAGWL